MMALTLSPALAAIIIKAHHGEKRGFFRWFENGVRAAAQGLRGPGRAGDTSLADFAARIRGHHRRRPVHVQASLPSSFVPDEDQGYFFAVVMAPDTASVDVVSEIMDRAQKITSADPAVQDVASIAGYSLLDGQLAEQRRRSSSRR